MIRRKLLIFKIVYIPVENVMGNFFGKEVLNISSNDPSCCNM